MPPEALLPLADARREESPQLLMEEPDMKGNIGRVGIAVLVVLAAASAQADEDVQGSADHPLISRYPGSYISDYRVAEFDEFTLPLGKLKEDGTTYEKSRHVEGKITHIIYEPPEHRSILELYRNYEGALKNARFEVLFSCVNGAGCGKGNPTLWAAAGQENWPDLSRLLTARLARPEGDVYVSLLIWEWGLQNHIELYVIETKPMESGLITVDAAALAGDIERTGHSALYGIYFDTGKAELKPESDAAIQEVAKLLRQDPALKLLVVGHTDNVGALPWNLDLSKRRAAAVVQALTAEHGIAGARLVALGDGPSAPVASNATEEGRAKNRRVELVHQ